MSDIKDPKTAGASDNTPKDDTGASSRKESWLSKNTGPMLAIGTVILTFIMFGYFVHMASTPSKESVELRCSAKILADADARFAQASSSNNGRMVPGMKEELRNERDKLKIQASNAKEAAEDAKERRGMVKDFVLYILGVLSSALTTIFGYYFGSSKGSSDKSTALNTSATRTPPQSPAPAPAPAPAPPESPAPEPPAPEPPAPE